MFYLLGFSIWSEHGRETSNIAKTNPEDMIILERRYRIAKGEIMREKRALR